MRFFSFVVFIKWTAPDYNLHKFYCTFDASATRLVAQQQTPESTVCNNRESRDNAHTFAGRTHLRNGLYILLFKGEMAVIKGNQSYSRESRVSNHVTRGPVSICFNVARA